MVSEGAERNAAAIASTEFSGKKNAAGLCQLRDHGSSGFLFLSAKRTRLMVEEHPIVFFYMEH